MTTRRQFLRASALAIASTAAAHELLAMAAPVRASLPKMTVYKSPTCGCCKLWVQHAEKAGFTATVHDQPESAMAATKKTMGIPVALQSCHTVVVGTYWVEGHVPADVIQKMLAEKPAILGIAAPGMPVGSPGMEMGTRKDPFDVIALDKTGKTRVYAKK